LNLVKAIIVML